MDFNKKNYTFFQLSIKDIRVNNPFSLLLSNLKILLHLYYLHIWFKFKFYYLSKSFIIKLHSLGTDTLHSKKYTNLRSPFVNKKSREHFVLKSRNFNLGFSLISQPLKFLKIFYTLFPNVFYGLIINGRSLSICYLKRSVKVATLLILFFKQCNFHNKSFTFLLFLLKQLNKNKQGLGFYGSSNFHKSFLSFKHFSTLSQEILHFYSNFFFMFLSKFYNIFALKTFNNVKINVYYCV